MDCEHEIGFWKGWIMKQWTQEEILIQLARCQIRDGEGKIDIYEEGGKYRITVRLEIEIKNAQPAVTD